jgi:hypothetical protein
VPVPDNKQTNMKMDKYSSILEKELNGDNNEKKESYGCTTDFVVQTDYGNGNTKVIIDDVHYGKKPFRIVVKDENQKTMITVKKTIHGVWMCQPQQCGWEMALVNR